MITEAERQRLIDFYYWLSHFGKDINGLSIVELIDEFIKQRCR